MWTRLVLLGVIASGCGDKAKGATTPQSATPTNATGTAARGDQCPEAVDKLIPLLKRNGMDIDASQRDRLIDECRQQSDSPIAGCIVAAKDDAAIEDCLKPKPKGEPGDQLDRATESLRTYFFVHETFATMSVPLTPAKPCCQYPNKKCPPEAKPDTILTEILELDLTTERSFRYRFESSGRKAIVEAVGDRDCDGTTITYRRELEQRDDGNMHITVTDPPDGSD